MFVRPFVRPPFASEASKTKPTAGARILDPIGPWNSNCLYFLKDQEQVYKHICLRKVFSKLSQNDQALKLDQISPFGVNYMFMLESELSSLPYDS